MNYKKKINNKKQQKSQTRAPVSAAPRRTPRVAYRGGLDMAGYAHMLADPCSATLQPGFYGSSEGYLARFHKVAAPPTLVGNAACGIILWVPDYTCQGYVSGTSATYNMISVVQNDSTTALDLSGCSFTVSSSSSGLADPAYAFVSGTTCSDARTLSACMRMSYLGQVATTQGMVGCLDIPFSVFDDVIKGGNMTIDGLFELSQSVNRTSLDAIEQKWTPNDGSSSFKGFGSNTVPGSSGDFAVNYNNGSYSLGASAAAMNPHVIGFVWKGFSTAVPASTILQFDCYKNIEWRPQSGSGLANPTPVRTSATSPAQAAVSMLDRATPGWRSATMKVAESAASKVAKSALAYSGQLLTRNAPKLLGFLA